jgi:hypothetical protein
MPFFRVKCDETSVSRLEQIEFVLLRLFIFDIYDSFDILKIKYATKQEDLS